MSGTTNQLLHSKAPSGPVWRRLAWLLLLVVVAAAAWHMGNAACRPSADPLEYGQSATPLVATAPAELQPSGVHRRVAAAEDESVFASLDRDGNRREGALQDGIAVVVRTASGQPQANVLVRMSWTRNVESEAVCGRDRGATDSVGLFRSSIHDLTDLQLVAVQSPQFGWLECRCGDDGWQWAQSPERTLIVVMPQPCDLTVAVTDTRGMPLAGVGVDVRMEARRLGPREHALLSYESGEAVTGADGMAHLAWAAGPTRISAGSETHRGDHVLVCDLPPGPILIRDVLMKTPDARPTRVHVVLPPAVEGPVEVNAETAQSTKVPEQLPVLYVDSVRRWFSVERVSDSEFLVSADAEPWWLRVKSSGCEPFGAWMDPERREVRIELSRLDPSKKCRVFGRVVGAAGAPIAQAFVAWKRAGGSWSSAIECDQGAYELLLEPKGAIWLRARGGLAQEIRGPIEFQAGAKIQVDFLLGSPGSVRGTLLDSRGTPTDGDVALWIIGSGGQREWLAGRSATASEGFVFEGLGTGDYLLRGEVSGADWPAWKRVRAGDDVVLRSGDGLEGMALIDGVVVDSETRIPLPGITVEGVGETDSQGRFRLVLPSGDAEIAAYGPGRAHQVTRLPALASGRNTVAIALPKAVTRFIRLVDSSGRSMPAATIRVIDDAASSASGLVFRQLLSADGQAEARDTDTDEVGRVDLHGVPAGRLRLSVERIYCEYGYWYRDKSKREFVLEAAEGVDSIAVLRW